MLFVCTVSKLSELSSKGSSARTVFFADHSYKLSTENLGFRRVRFPMIKGEYLGSDNYHVDETSRGLHPFRRKRPSRKEFHSLTNCWYSSQSEPTYPCTSYDSYFRSCREYVIPWFPSPIKEYIRRLMIVEYEMMCFAVYGNFRLWGGFTSGSYRFFTANRNNDDH